MDTLAPVTCCQLGRLLAKVPQQFVTLQRILGRAVPGCGGTRLPVSGRPPAGQLATVCLSPDDVHPVSMQPSLGRGSYMGDSSSPKFEVESSIFTQV